MIVKVASGAEYEKLGSVRATGYMRVGSASAPSNTTAGDLTSLRLHVGTDAAFGTGISFEINAAKYKHGGTIANSASAEVAHAFSVTFNGAGDNPIAYQVAPVFSAADNVTSVFGMLFQPQAQPASTKTITTMIGLYAQSIFLGNNGAVTTSYAMNVAVVAATGTLKPGKQVGLNIENQGSASITNAVAVRLNLPTGATNNYYLEFVNADATDPTGGGGAATGRIACLIGGVLRYIPYY